MNHPATDPAATPLRMLPMRLHHHAYTTDDHETTRHFYERILGLPLAAFEVERERLGNGWIDLGYAFYELGDGSTLAFFTFDDPKKQSAWKARAQSLFVHISLLVDGATQNEIEERLTKAGHEPFVLRHGFCTSLYVKDPNGLTLEFSVDHEDASAIAQEMAASMREWMQGGRKLNTHAGPRLVANRRV